MCQIQDLTPKRACLRLDRRFAAEIDHAYAVQRAGVDDDSIFDLCLAEHCVALAAHRDLDAALVRELDHLQDVLRRPGFEDSDWWSMDDEPKVASSRLPCGFVNEQRTAQVLEFGAQRLRGRQRPPHGSAPLRMAKKRCSRCESR